MKEKDKILIMNHHGDIKVNEWTLIYIQKKWQHDKNINIFLENVAYEDFQNIPNEQCEFKEKLEYLEEMGDKNNHDSDAYLKLAEDLFNLKIPVKGLKNKELVYKAEEKVDNHKGDLESAINSVPKEHDEFMLGVIKKAQGPLIAVIGALHLIAWLLKNEISTEDYAIILPNHDKILNGLQSNEYNVQEIYEQILNIQGIQVVDIDLAMSLMGEDN
jgi:hypothetical protein